MSDLKLDINISKKQIEEMAKSAIREIIEENINITMNTLNIAGIIENKIKTIDNKIKQIAEQSVKKYMDDMRYKIARDIENKMHNIIMEEIQKKPISDMKVYLNVCTDNNY